jgi:hypothetical protein
MTKDHTNVEVVVSRRFGSIMPYHVCIAGHDELWEQGYSEHEAIERLKCTHPTEMEGRIVSVTRRGLVTQDLRDMPEDKVNYHLMGIVELRDACQSAINFAEENSILRCQIDRQSRIIAALVVANGGEVNGEVWDRIHRQVVFSPYTIRTTESSVYIELSDVKTNATS